ncbi:class A beta-lactamase [Nocardioides lianchengensis]|uniref:Beta-lactamase n=1 Tax=Nocardioides lianchengensis TaxID=1045774 RepID=A0A1G6V7G0_9ACTN|nr:class A beta-lactamase [Nocardioides lianchengensis]NYG11168.1 beta-lactamase class A [Nocardioides lianchengensis]SDD49471.1 beta-lactamase class A [Nocardioides lianchengensis]
MTPRRLGRRPLLLAGSLGLLAGCADEDPTPPRTPTPAPPAAPARPSTRIPGLARLERRSGARIGVYVDPPTEPLEHRADERFALCSTFKTVLAGAVLAGEPEPGASLREDLRRAVSDSDNDAANRLIDRLGGPASVTRFARTLGDDVTRLDRREPDLNSAVPGDPRDTTSPRAIAATYRTLVLGDALPRGARDLLTDLLVGSTTGAERIRAGLPEDWWVGDKTGTGGYGSTHDVAVVRPPGGEAFVLAVYTSYDDPAAEPDQDLVAAVARLVVSAAAGPAGSRR